MWKLFTGFGHLDSGSNLGLRDSVTPAAQGMSCCIWAEASSLSVWDLITSQTSLGVCDMVTSQTSLSPGSKCQTWGVRQITENFTAVSWSQLSGHCALLPATRQHSKSIQFNTMHGIALSNIVFSIITMLLHLLSAFHYAIFSILWSNRILED